jgi:hypothetical protein
MKRIYISGPMTGVKDHNFPAFNEAAEALRSNGFDAVNPVDINPDVNTSWEECMRHDIKALCDCDGVALLPGWTNSKGATLEVGIAGRLGLSIKLLEDWIA